MNPSDLRRLTCTIREDWLDSTERGAALDEDLAQLADNLRGECTYASDYLRHRLHQAGLTNATVVFGYFAVDWPDPETCACGRYDDAHEAVCFLPPHAWVQVGDWLIDMTVGQFADQCEPAPPEVCVVPTAEADQLGWRLHRPAGALPEIGWGAHPFAA